MKVEYVRSAFGIGPDMLIAGSDYKAALDSEEENNYLRFAVDGFTQTHGFENHLKHRDLYCAKGWLEKSSNVLFVAKEAEFGYRRYARWCEIYVVTNGKILNVITSEDGEHFTVNAKPIEQRAEKREVKRHE